MWMIITGVVLVVAVLSATLAVVCLVQSFTGRQVIRPERSRRSAEQIRRESRWAAGEWACGAVAMSALLAGSDALFLIGCVGMLGFYLGLARSRRRSGATTV